MEVVKNNNGIPKKVNRKHVTIQQSNLLEKVLVTKYKKWQLKIAKWIGVEVADAYEYMYKVQYKGNTRLKENDVVFNSEQVLFVVVRETNRIALIVTSNAYVNKPKVYGNLTILEKPKK